MIHGHLYMTYGSTTTMILYSVVAPSWEEMEFHQADCERKDDAMLVERLISYGSKITQCVAGAKQEVI
jgi:hypothetical protein